MGTVVAGYPVWCRRCVRSPILRHGVCRPYGRYGTFLVVYIYF